MNKKLTALVVFSVFLMGCGQSNFYNENELIDEVEKQVLEGEIITKQDGKVFVKTEDDIELQLNSVAFNLSDAEYQSKKYRLLGRFEESDPTRNREFTVDYLEKLPESKPESSSTEPESEAQESEFKYEPSEDEVVLIEDFKQFESAPYSFKAQYPKNWYYQGVRGEDEILYSYLFSDRPIDEGETILRLDVVNKPMPEGSISMLNEKKSISIASGNQYEIWIEKTPKTSYRVRGSVENIEAIKQIAASID
jgi:hypothetical protein